MNFLNEFVNRMKNFYCNHNIFEKQVSENPAFYEELSNLRKKIIDDLERSKELIQKQLLETVFSEVFKFVVEQNVDFIIFHQHYTFISPYTSFHSDELPESTLYDDVYNACLFTTLCIFIDKSTRITGRTLTELVYNYSSNHYNDKKSGHYCTLEYPSDDFLKEVDRLKQERKKILSSRPVYDILPKWQAIRKDSILEYKFRFFLDRKDIDPALKDTYKRIGNLYNDINNVLHKGVNNNEDINANYADILENAYNNFLSKLKKIKYEKYLELVQEIVSYICENDTYCGMSIFKLEKELSPLITFFEVESMLACKNNFETKCVLTRSSVLNSICFPKLYRDFLLVPEAIYTANYARVFPIFLEYVVSSSLLIIDELVEKGYLEEDWESFFLNTINEMTESVFYSPKKIDFTAANVSQKNQDKFVELLSYHVKLELEDAFHKHT